MQNGLLPATKIRFLVSLLVLTALTLLGLTTDLAAGNLKRQIYDGITPDGGVQDRCLNNEIPVYIKKVDKNLFFVRVKNRWSGRVKAKDYGEARNIGCQQKSGMILYDGTKNESSP